MTGLFSVAIPTDMRTAIIVVGMFLVITLAVFTALETIGLVNRRHLRRVAALHSLLRRPGGRQRPVPDRAEMIRRWPFQFLAAYQESVSHVIPPDSHVERIEAILQKSGVDQLLIRQLLRGSRFRRMRAATYLAYVPSPTGGIALDQALRHERSDPVRLRIVYAIVHRRYIQSIPTILDSLRGATDDYTNRVIGVLLNLGNDLTQLVSTIYERREPEIQGVFVAAAAHHPTTEMRTYLEHIVDIGDTAIAREAFRVLMNHYARELDPAQYLSARDPYYVNLAVEALGGVPGDQTIDTIIPFLATAEIRDSAIIALVEMIDSVPRLLPSVIHRFRDETDTVIQQGLAEVLATRAEYICERAIRERWSNAQRLLSMLVATGKASGVLAFLNRNRDRPIERELCTRIGGAVREDPWLAREYSIYGSDSVIALIGLERQHVSRDQAPRSRENPQAMIVALIVAAATLLPVAVFAAVYWANGGSNAEYGSVVTFFGHYIIWFEELYVWYAIALNSIYLALLLMAVPAVLGAAHLWKTRPPDFLYTHGILPAVSIIAPAYNESETIVESVRALLNLRYSEYEVIVVNDGSTDNTLELLIEMFELERTKVQIGSQLETQPIRSVYRNRNIPALLVIDKSNGGKADSLNAGINASRHPYYAAIDADSLLEPDALIHLAVETLDSEEPVTATGGNVLPINGCHVEYGSIDRVRFPRRTLARFQMVEYVRAFMTGRTGWARLKSLLIISGAFGLFRTSEVIAARGYLTSSERHLKDTVAEDMELVVRLTRRLRETGQKGVIRYAPGANCWTEVPETLGILAAQRDRWQRGLVDVLFFHHAITFRSRYGRAGMLAMPYHNIFELIGPWIEAQALVLLVAGLATGLLPLAVAGAVFVATIGLGIITSFLAVRLAEWPRPFFRRSDRFLLLFFAILENFGYRQLSSLLRLRGYISIVRRRTGWGTMRRKGFGKEGTNL